MMGIFIDPWEDEIGHETLCKRCGKKARATRYHTAYLCPANAAITETIFINTNQILKHLPT